MIKILRQVEVSIKGKIYVLNKGRYSNLFAKGLKRGLDYEVIKKRVNDKTKDTK